MILSRNSSPIGKIPAVWEFSGWPHEQKEALLSYLRPYYNSDRKRADDVILASEPRSSAIVTKATVGGAEFDVDGRIILANETYCALAGHSFDQLRTLRVQDAMHPDDWQQNAAWFARLFAEGE